MLVNIAFAAFLASHLSSAANIHRYANFDIASRNAAPDQGIIGLNPINDLPVAPVGRPDAGKLRAPRKKHTFAQSAKHSKSKGSRIGRKKKHSGKGKHHLGLGKHSGHSRHKGTEHGKAKRPHDGQASKKPKGHKSTQPQDTQSVPPVTSTPAPAPAPAPTPTPAPAQPSPPAPSTTQSSGGGDGGPDGQPYTGDITYYTPGMGSCGITNAESDSIVALAEDMMASMDGGNPNNNPYCGRSITISYGGKTAQATIEDKCPGCAGAGLDLTPSLFQQFADLGEGRVSGVQWWFN